VEERAWFEDTGGELGIEAVRLKSFKPFSGVLSRGFSSAPIWIRLRIKASPLDDYIKKRQDTMILRIRPAHLDEIELFDDLIETSDRRVTGDLHAWRNDEYQSHYFNFKLPWSEEPRYVWLRLKSNSIRVVDMDVHSLDDSRRSDLHMDMLAGAYLGCMILFLGWAINLYLNSPERLLAFFMLKQGAAVAYAMFSLGYVRILLDGVWSPAAINTASNLVFLIFSSTAILYQLTFLQEIKSPRWGLFMFGLGALTLPFGSILIAFGRTMEAMQMNLAIIFGATLLGMLLTVLAKYPASSERVGSLFIPKRTIVGAHVLVFLSIVASIFAGAGGWLNSSVVLYLPLLHGLLSGVILTYLLQVRARLVRQQQARASAELEAIRSTISAERLFREDQQHMLAMLAHELKTPLAVIKMLTGQKTSSPNADNSVKLAITDMTLIVDRCLQAGRLQDEGSMLRLESIDPSVVLRDTVKQRNFNRDIRCEPNQGLRLYTDVQIVRILFGNLLENAVRYSEAGSVIEIQLYALHKDGVEGMVLKIKNRPGSAGRPDPSRVFTKYYRAAKAYRQSGSGLGLYLVDGFARRLGGAVRYVPDDEWVIFELWLPL